MRRGMFESAFRRILPVLQAEILALSNQSDAEVSAMFENGCAQFVVRLSTDVQ